MTTIEVAANPPRVVLGGLVIGAAPAVAELHAVLGPPSRIDAGEAPAPVGHRNNQTHVYDAAGLTFTEHHHTRRAQAVCCWFGTAEPRFRFAPREAFRGRLVFGRVAMPPGGDERAFLAASPFGFAPWLGGSWAFCFDGFAVHVEARGQRLASGRRSRSRRVCEVWVSWPHDNWAAPVAAEPADAPDPAGV